MGISDTIQAMPYQDARENAPSVWFENSLSDGSGSLSDSSVDTGDEDDSRSQANLLKQMELLKNASLKPVETEVDVTSGNEKDNDNDESSHEKAAMEMTVEVTPMY